MAKILRNKNCKECPQNTREDMVWKKGYDDGMEVGINIGSEQSKGKYQDSYAGVLHHILDLHKEGFFTSNQYYYAMDQIKGIIKELNKN